MTKQEYKQECLDRLNLFATLEKDWNGNEADPFDPILIEKCKNIVNQMDYVPEIFPAADDSIQFEFSRFDGAELLFFIYVDKIEGLLVESDKDKAIIENITENDLIKEVNRFYLCNS